MYLVDTNVSERSDDVMYSTPKMCVPLFKITPPQTTKFSNIIAWFGIRPFLWISW